MRNEVVTLWLLGCFGLICAVACNSLSEPILEPAIDLVLRVEPEADGTLRAEAVVTNVGAISVYYWEGCGCGVYLRVQGDDGSSLRLRCGPEPACPCGNIEFRPGETTERTLEFRGEHCVWGMLGEELQPVLPGNFSIVASFSYTRGNWRDPGEVTTLNESYHFVWD